MSLPVAVETRIADRVGNIVQLGRDASHARFDDEVNHTSESYHPTTVITKACTDGTTG